MPIFTAILSLLFGVVGVWIWLLCLPTKCPPWRERRVRHYHGSRPLAAAPSRPAPKGPAGNGLVEAQALNALIANRGRWYCASCWGAASGFAPTSTELIALDRVAQIHIAQSKEYERTVVDGTRGAPGSSVCSQLGQPYCVFDRDGTRRTGWSEQDWLVRAKPL